MMLFLLLNPPLLNPLYELPKDSNVLEQAASSGYAKVCRWLIKNDVSYTKDN